VIGRFRGASAVLALALAAAGCGDKAGPAGESVTMAAGGASDADRVRAADVSILFFGNSHTAMHDMPGLIAGMIRSRQPGKTVYTHHLPVAFLEGIASDPLSLAEIDSRPWTHVVLQAQKISTSGKFDYPRTDGIEYAKRAKARGAAVVFYPEWGLRGKSGDGARQEGVYREMARAAGVGVAPVARAWDLALAERPDLPLHSADGNHQSAVGAFLTACVLYGQLTGDSPAPLADYPYPAATEADRKFLADVAARTLATEPAAAKGP
jgi:hypothetical protein